MKTGNLSKSSLLTALAAPAAVALLAIGLASTARAAPVMVFQADTNGNRGTANTGPVQPGWTGISGTNAAGPWTNSYSINGIAIDLAVGAANAGWRNDRTQLTVPNVGPLAPMYNSSVFAAGGFDLKMTGLTAGTTYNFILYATDTGNNVGDVHWNYSLAGDKTSPVDAGWINQPGSTTFTPAANTGITQATKGIAMLSTTFTAGSTPVDFFSIVGTVAVLSGFELYEIPASALAADAGADKTVSPSTPSVTIGASPTASGGTGPYTYLWSPSTGLSSDMVSNPTAAPTSTTIYTVQVTDSLSATASDTVTVNYPLAANAGADKLCTPSSPSTTIGATNTANGGTPGYTYSWTSDPAGFTSTDANPSVSPTETTTYTVQVTDALSATSSDSVIVTYAVPDPNLISVDFVYNAGGLSAPCEGNTTVAAGDVKNALGLTFSGQVGPWNAVNTGGNNAGAIPIGPIVLKDGAGNTTAVNFLMGTAVASGNGSAWRNNYLPAFVVGGVKNLRAEQPYLYPGVFGDHYYWQFTELDPAGKYDLVAFGAGAATTHTATGVSTVAGTQDAEGDWNWSTISPDSSGKITGYFYTSSGTPGLFGFQLYKLTVPLVASAGSDKSVSAGLPTVQIGGSPTASGGTGPYTYLWTPSAGLSSDTDPNPMASPTSTTLYTVTVTDSLSASEQSSMTVTFTAPPLVADAGPDKSLAPGAPSAQIGGSPSASGAFPPYTYSWTPTTGLNDPLIANPVASPSSPTTYTLTVTDAHSTQVTDTVTVDYPLVVNAGPDQLVTPGSPSVQIGGSPLTYGGTAPFTYSWDPPAGLDFDNIANPTAEPNTTTTYTVTVTDSLNVQASDSVTVTYAVPNANLISVDFKQGSGTTCSGDTTLTGTTMKNASGNMFSGQVGNWNPLNIGTYNNNSATSGFLNNGGGTATSAKLALGLATGLDATAAGGWRCNPNEG
ncbi:MAG: hypothetical protein NTW21_35770, partial [Verrucomicrobia bacterium]|nr:hypothetical protein [Verrucomicrobiota bacterium]